MGANCTIKGKSREDVERKLAELRIEAKELNLYEEGSVATLYDEEAREYVAWIRFSK